MQAAGQHTIQQNTGVNMIGVSGITRTDATVLDMEITTDGVTTDYSFPMTAFADGAVLLLTVSFTTSSTKHCSYIMSVHKQNNIGITANVFGSREYDGMAIAFSGAGYTALSIKLNSAVVGTIKIAPVLTNV